MLADFLFFFPGQAHRYVTIELKPMDFAHIGKRLSIGTEALYFINGRETC